MAANVNDILNDIIRSLRNLGTVINTNNSGNTNGNISNSIYDDSKYRLDKSGREGTEEWFRAQEAKHKRVMEDIAIENASYAIQHKFKMKHLKEEIKENDELIKEIKAKLELAKEDAENTGLKDEERKIALEKQIELTKTLSGLEEKQLKLAKEKQKSNYASAIAKDMQTIQKGVVDIYNNTKNFAKPWADADHAASKYAKTVGMTASGMKKFRENTIDNVANGIAGKFNMSTKELLEAQANFIKASGRNMMISKEDQIDIAALSKFANGSDIAAQFETFGLSVSESSKHVGKMFDMATKTGISWEKYSSNLVKNVKLAQNYTFKNGLKGLESMAKKATELKLDMQQVANFANKVSSIEGAVETSARLQVLGGSFSYMADPMGLLREGLTDMESLQDRMVNMIEGLGTFNKATGQVEVNSYNRQRIQAAAEAMGVDYSQLMEATHAKARIREVESQMKNLTNIQGLDKDMQDLIKNQATIKDGKAGIVDKNGNFKSLDKVNGDDREWLIAQSKSDSDNIRDIAVNLRSLIDIQEGVEKGIEAKKAQFLEKTGMGAAFKGILGSLSTANWWLGTIAAASMGTALLTGFGRGTHIYKNFANWFGRGKTGVYTLGKGVTKGGWLSGLFKGSSAAATNTLTTNTLNTSSAVAGGGLKALLGTTGGGIAAGGLVAGIGLLGNHFTNKAVADGKMKAGGNSHKAAKMASQAATFGGIGMAIGSAIAPGIGTAIVGTLGAAVGAFIGHQQAQKAKNADILDNRLKELGITRKGDYGARKLRKYEKALETGELSDRLRRRLLQEGDTELLKAIEKKREEVEAKKEKKEEQKAKAKANRMTIGYANISIGSANLGSGLGMGFGPVPILKAIAEKGFGWVTNKKKDKSKEEENKNIPNTFNININGTLKLTNDNGQSVDIISMLNSDPNLKRNLAELLYNEMVNNINRQGLSGTGFGRQV